MILVQIKCQAIHCNFWMARVEILRELRVAKDEEDALPN